MMNCRDEIPIIKEYWLLNCESKKDVPAGILNKVTFVSVSSKENPVKNKENPVKNTENAQSKVKESKEKENTTTERAPARTREEERSSLLAFGIPESYIDYFYSRIKSGGYLYTDLVAACKKWWEKDQDGWGLREQKESFKTFDPDEAFATALNRSRRNGG